MKQAISLTSPIDATVAITGSGLVGGVLACALAQAGVRVVAVDSHLLADQSRDGRVCTISLPSRRLLEATGIWPDVAGEVGEIRDVRVIEGDSPLLFHYGRRDVDDEAIGWVIENAVMRRAVQRRLASLPTATLLSGSSVEILHREVSRVHLTLSDGRALSAQLVVAADGTGSLIRTLAGIDVTRRDHVWSAITCLIEHDYPHEGIAYKRLLPAGLFTILPLTGKCSAVIWSERIGQVSALMRLDDEAFRAELTHRFGDFLGALRVISPRHAEPLSSLLTDVCGSHRLALIGDAAHAMHPLSGQGINMGLRDVGALTETLVNAARLGFDVGEANVLAHFQRWRRFDTTAMLLLNDGLARLFSIDSTPIRVVFGAGLAVVNRIGPLKKMFMRHAMGMTGDLPKLMRGEIP